MPRTRLLALPLAALLCPSPGCKKPDEQAARLLDEADQALRRQQWDEAFAKAHAAALLSGTSEGIRNQARRREEQARSEMQAQGQYARFMGALDTDLDTAMAAYRALPQGSHYRQLAQGAYERIRPQYVSDHLRQGEQALKNGRCDDWMAQVQLVLDVDPGNAKALELRKQNCTKPRD